MTIRNRGYAIIRELRDMHGVDVTVTRDGSLLLTAIDAGGVSTEAATLAKAFKRQIIVEIQRKGRQCKSSA